MNKPNLNKIIADNLDKAKFQSKSQPSLPTDNWLDSYSNGGNYISDRAKATQFGQYKNGGGMRLDIPVIDDAGNFNQDGIWVPDWKTMAAQAKKLGSKKVKTRSGNLINFNSNWEVTNVDDNPSMKMGGGMFPEYHSFAPPMMSNGGGLLSRTVTCSNCGWSWKAVDGGKDVMTCHKCGGMIKMKEGGSYDQYDTGGEPCVDGQGNVVPCDSPLAIHLSKEEIENKRLKELGTDAYSAMQPFYNTVFEAANKYANPKTGLVSNFNNIRAAVKGAIKHPNVLFMKRHQIPAELREAADNLYNVQSYDTPISNGSQDWHPSEWAEPIKEHHGLSDLIERMRLKHEENKAERQGKRNRGNTGCYGANCTENEIQDQAKYGGDMAISNLQEGNWLNQYAPGGITTDTTTIAPYNFDLSKFKQPVRTGLDWFGGDPTSRLTKPNMLTKIVRDDRNESYQSQINKSDDFLKSWYSGRVNDPRYGNTAKQRISEIDNINEIPVTAKQLEQQNAAGYYMPGTKNIYINPNDIYSRGTGAQVHEKTHELYDQIYQHNQDNIITSKLRPKKGWITPRPDLDPLEYNYEYFSDPTEVAARLNQFRRRFGLNPKHKYTSDEMKKIMSTFYHMKKGTGINDRSSQSGDTNIDELFNIIGNDPTKLAELNDEVVMNQFQSKGMTYSKFGGLVNQYAKGGPTCPKGQVKVNGKCVKIDSEQYMSNTVTIDGRKYDRSSEEYKDLYRFGPSSKGGGGIGYYDEKGNLVSSHSTLPEVVISKKDKDTQTFYDNLSDENQYAFGQLTKKYGPVNIKNTEGTGIFNGTAGHYNPLNNTITISPKSDDPVDTYIAELSHKLQFDKRGKLNTAVNWLSDDLVDYIKGDDPYKDESGMEHEAHSIIEPKLRDEFNEYRYDDILGKNYNKFKTGGITCPTGQINIDGKCYDKNSEEYKNIYNKGIGSWQKLDQATNQWVSADSQDPNAEFISSTKTLKPVVVTAKVNPAISKARKEALAQVGSLENFGKQEQSSYPSWYKGSSLYNAKTDQANQQQNYNNAINTRTYQNVIAANPQQPNEDRLAYMNRLNAIAGKNFVQNAKGFNVSEPFQPSNLDLLNQWRHKGFEHVKGLAQSGFNPTAAPLYMASAINQGNQPVKGLTAQEAKEVGITQPFESSDNLFYNYMAKPGLTALDNMGNPSGKAARTVANRYMGPNETDKVMTSLLNPLNYIGPGELLNGSKFLGEAAGISKGIKNAGRYLTEETALKNASKYNPFAFKPKEGYVYRGIGDAGLKDATESGIFKSPTGNDKTYWADANEFQYAKNHSKTTIELEPATWEGNSLVGGDYKTSKSIIAEYPKNQDLFHPEYKWGMQDALYSKANLPISEGNIYKEHWWQGYKPIEFNQNIDFSKYLTQEEAVAARAQRLISQNDKPGWNEQFTPDLEERLNNAVENHNPASDYEGSSLGANTKGRTATEVSKNANLKGVPLTDANKARVAAHETGHYYSNSPQEGAEWLKHFDLDNLRYKTKVYLRGKERSMNYANEIRERAAQLKDYIAQKNGIPLNEDFVITQPMLDDAIKNYVNDTGLDNTMSSMLGALKDKKGFLKTMNKYALGTLPIVAGAAALDQKKHGGQTNWLNQYAPGGVTTETTKTPFSLAQKAAAYSNPFNPLGVNTAARKPATASKTSGYTPIKLNIPGPVNDSNSYLVDKQKAYVKAITKSRDEAKATVANYRKTVPQFANLSDAEILERDRASKASQQNQQQATIKQSKPQSTASKVLDIAKHPVTAFAYKAKGQDIPDNFVAGETNPYDIVAGFPAEVIQSGLNLFTNNVRHPFNTLAALGKSGVNAVSNLSDGVNVFNDDSNQKALSFLGDAANVLGAGEFASPYISQYTPEIKALAEAGILGTLNQISKPVSKMPGIKNAYKWAAGRVASQGAQEFRKISDILSLKKGTYKGTGVNYEGTSGSDRNLIRNYLYGDNRGFTSTNIQQQGLEDYVKRYGPLKKYQLSNEFIDNRPIEAAKNFSPFFEKEIKGISNLPQEEQNKLIQQYLKENGEYSFGSEGNMIGTDDIAGHMKYLKYDPKTNSYSIKSQDIWKFTPEDYIKKYQPNAVRTVVDKTKKVPLVERLANYSKQKQVEMMDRAGKPFILLDERPLSFETANPNRTYHQLDYEPGDMTQEEIIQLSKPSQLKGKLNKKKQGGNVLENYYNSRLPKADDGLETEAPKPREYKGYSIVNFLAENGYPVNKEYRKNLAAEYNVEGYDYSAEKNTELLRALVNDENFKINDVQEEQQAPTNTQSRTVAKATSAKKKFVNPAVLSLMMMNLRPKSDPIPNLSTNNLFGSVTGSTPKKAVTKKAAAPVVKPTPIAAENFVFKPYTPEYTPVVQSPNTVAQTQVQIPAFNPYPFLNQNTLQPVVKEVIPANKPVVTTKKNMEETKEQEEENNKPWYNKLYEAFDKGINNNSAVDFSQMTFAPSGFSKDAAKTAFNNTVVGAANLISPEKGAIAKNYFKRQELKNNDNLQETKTKFTIPTVGKPAISTGDTVNIDKNRYVIPAMIDLNQTKWGVRNRDEYKDINTEAADITTFQSFENAKNYFTKNPNDADNSTYIGVDNNGAVKVGNKKDFLNTDYRITKTFGNKIVDFVDDEKGGMKLKPSSAKASNKHLSPVVKVIGDDGKISEGSMNLLIPKGNRDTKSFGQITGGRVIFKTPKGEQFLVSGSAEDIRKAFKQIKGDNPYVEAITLDNGSYAMGLRNKNKKITAQELRDYQGSNTTGSAFLYLQPGNYSTNSNSATSKLQFKDVQMTTPNIRTEKDESFKKGHPLANEQKAVVLHHTGYTDTTGVSSGMSKAMKGVADQFSQPGESSHVVIDFDGTRYNFAKPSQVTFHAGKSMVNGRENVNDFGIGIEFQGDTSNKPLTDKQIQSFVEYIGPIIKNNKIPLSSIITHKQIRTDYMKAHPEDKQVQGKPDVNERDYNRIMQVLKKKGYYKEGGVVNTPIMKQGSSVNIGDEINVTDEQLEQLRKQGYKFDII